MSRLRQRVLAAQGLADAEGGPVLREHAEQSARCHQTCQAGDRTRRFVQVHQNAVAAHRVERLPVERQVVNASFEKPGPLGEFRPGGQAPGRDGEHLGRRIGRGHVMSGRGEPDRHLTVATADVQHAHGAGA